MEDQMDKKPLQRRDFLKNIGSFFLGAILVPFERLFRGTKDADAKPSPIREAMHYSTDDNLAG